MMILSCLADVNIQTHFQLEKHIVFLKMSKDLSENTRPKYGNHLMDRFFLPFDGNHLMDPFNFPFNGKVVWGMA